MSQLCLSLNDFDTESYEIFTKGNQEIDFILEYPADIVDTLNQLQSDAVIAEKTSDYNTSIRLLLLKKLTEADGVKIKENIFWF
ncbi:hypothetical protein [Ornithinibacillus bavariensis]|uniref:Uncharacterized protein n=1 Tax=Ornithinibacillus bavariensis TaxID=545502 RepID=A0A919X4T0_9BACI|nr:hypothetical protein [Ornithinibacillus bavariensis]GIO25516.1 hypothetical protein J43TS3_01270 [Ornithinibacillus bavariensis]HAM80619.1 hypothetical protein [Ornithinibacillus sp.]